MPSVTFDGRSFSVGGKRIWLVAGSMSYARIPHGLWSDRIHAAKLAGLNCISVPVFWNLHEPRPNQFDFQGQKNIREFVQLIGREGLMCILRPGPYVGEDWDLGGLPPWVLSVKDIKLRTANQPFLELCSRYISALADQLRDLQVSSPPSKQNPGTTAGGPIILVQNESAWTCGDDKLAHGYLGELNRYLREAGFSVPFANSNNLWQGVEGEVNGWTGTGDLLAVVRQLRSVQADQPRVVTSFESHEAAVWGDPEPQGADGFELQHELAQILAAGGQFSIEPFHGGTNWGFMGGRKAERASAYVTTSYDRHAPLTEAGLPGASFTPVRLLCTFASRFARVLSNLDPAYQPVVSTPVGHPVSEVKRDGKMVQQPVVSTVHAAGAHGGVVFLLAEAPGIEQQRQSLLLPDGSSLSVPMQGQRAVWCLLSASLGPRTTLDFSNISLLGTVGRVIVAYGPAGETAHLSVNGGPVQLRIPTGRTPLVHEHEGQVLVICNLEQIAETFLNDDAVYCGVSGITPANEPIAPVATPDRPTPKSCLKITSDGVRSNVNLLPSSKPAPAKVSIEHWVCADTEAHATGESARYASIDGPGDLCDLGSPYGLGWYRLKLKNTSTRKATLMAPEGGDRLHVFIDGKRQGVIGAGPGAALSLAVSLERGEQTMCVLAENLGRPSGGSRLAERKGLYGHVLEVHASRLAKPTVEPGDPIDILSVQSPLWRVHEGDTTHPERITWALGAKKRDVVVVIDRLPTRGVLVAGGKPVRFIERGSLDQVVVTSEAFGRQTPSLQLALVGESGESVSPKDHLNAIASCVEIHDVEQIVSEKAEWAFARWEAPTGAQYRKPDGKASGPTWWRGSFTPADTDAPMYLEATGLTKGQIYINDHHVGRYFVATANAKPVGPQTRYYIPRPWLLPQMPNQILIFDEHGGTPSKCRLVYDAPQ